MTRTIDPHPFQPTWQTAASATASAVVAGWSAILAAGADEPGVLECLAVIGLAALLPLIPPDWLW